MTLLGRVLAALCVFLASGTAHSAAIVTDIHDAAQWLAGALPRAGYRADFSVDSLRDIDRFFDEQAPNGKPRPGGLLGDGTGAILFAVGAYVGEVIRRAAGGAWQGVDADPNVTVDVALKLPGGSIIWPMQRVMKRFANGREDSLYDYARSILRR
jgi:hypothetical protein